jgi:flavin reductase (DIM6/NTAB) family NADH-FMN oxidoreductase RutF
MTTSTEICTEIDQHRPLRDVLGRFATGVTVITTRYGGQWLGLTVNSFTALSLEPPLVLWCLRRKSAVNILAADQRNLAEQFTARGERFAGVAARVGPHGLALLDGTVGTLICRPDWVFPAGDHVVLIGSVLYYDARPGPSLLFLDGTYHTSAADGLWNGGRSGPESTSGPKVIRAFRQGG